MPPTKTARKRKANRKRKTKNPTGTKPKAKSPRQSEHVYPPACRVCGATQIDRTGRLRVHHHAGLTRENKPYTRIERRDVRCGHCGQWRVECTYPFDPKDWVGPLPTGEEGEDVTTEAQRTEGRGIRVRPGE